MNSLVQVSLPGYAVVMLVALALLPRTELHPAARRVAGGAQERLA